MRLKKLILPILAGFLFLTPLVLSSCNESTTTTTEDDTASATLTDLSISSANATTAYCLGEEFDSSNLVVAAIYSDYSTVTLTSDDYEVDSSEFDDEIAGTYTIYVVYEEGTVRKVANYDVTVASIVEEVDPYLLGITASGMDTDYSVGDSLDTSGLVVTAEYSDGTESDVTDSATIDTSSFDSSTMGACQITFTYSEEYTVDGQTETKTSKTFLLVTVSALLKYIEFESGTTTLEQDTLGPDGTSTSIDTSDWVVYAIFVNSNYEELDPVTLDMDDVDVSGFDSGVSGTQTVTLSYTYDYVVDGTEKSTTKTTTVDITVDAIADPDYTMLANSLDTATKSTTALTVDDVITISAGYSVDANSQSYGSLSFTQRIKLNKKGSDHNIAVTMSTSGTIAIYARSSSSTETRTLGIYDADGNLVGSGDCTDDMLKIKVTLDTAGTYYIYSTDGACNIYGIQIWYD